MAAARRPPAANAPRDRLACLIGGCWAAVWLCATPANAGEPQIGLSASLSSDYRYRGMSLSDELPALSVSVSYDHPSGAYFSATALAGPTEDGGPRLLGYQANVGYARAVGQGFTLDAGLAHTDVIAFLQPRYHVRYAEAYVGAAFGHASVRVYYSPDYLGEDASAVYVDAGAWLAPAADWRLVGHVGVLTPVSAPDLEVRREQYDARLGLARMWPRWRAELAWSRFGPGAEYPPGHRQAKDAVVLTATRYF